MRYLIGTPIVLTFIALVISVIKAIPTDYIMSGIAIIWCSFVGIIVVVFIVSIGGSVGEEILEWFKKWQA